MESYCLIVVGALGFLTCKMGVNASPIDWVLVSHNSHSIAADGTNGTEGSLTLNLGSASMSSQWVGNEARRLAHLVMNYHLTFV